MEGLPQQPTLPEPAPERHPTKGRCCRCGQPLARLWLWELGRWQPDKWCSDECYRAEQQSEDARRIADVRARRVRALNQEAA